MSADITQHHCNIKFDTHTTTTPQNVQNAPSALIATTSLHYLLININRKTDTFQRIYLTSTKLLKNTQQYVSNHNIRQNIIIAIDIIAFTTSYKILIARLLYISFCNQRHFEYTDKIFLIQTTPSVIDVYHNRKNALKTGTTCYLYCTTCARNPPRLLTYQLRCSQFKQRKFNNTPSVKSGKHTLMTVICAKNIYHFTNFC
eukprot:TRINITY_DN2589_c0_g2_i5.p1 TRINITY_DN2589_c0_g2~~TRINITY_DN2589_c0_g2_i5.p1  ORF type:complete len:201 (-),score=-22.64 TRINITY_DN2589_c0_g2_i5:553-1155(-)